MRSGAAQDAGDGRIRCGTARPDGVRQEVEHQQAVGGGFEEVRRGGREVSARISSGAGDQRGPQGRRPRAGGRIQAQRKSGRNRREQRTRLRRSGEAPSFPRRRRISRFHVSPRSRFDRRIQLSVARVPRNAHGGADGHNAGDGAESGDRRSGYRGQRAAGEGRGPGTQRRLRSGAEGQEIAMPSVDVLDLNNKKVGSVELADAVFGAPINEDLLYEAVRHYLAGRRRGTASTKTRHEVAGSGKKLWKQKGTGRARMGSIRSPLWRHGGTVHGPQPHSFAYHLPKKMQLGALRSALSAKLRDGELKVVNEFSVSEAKTKLMRQALNTLEAVRTVLLVDNADNRNLQLSSRNLEGVKLVSSRQVNVYDLLGHEQVLLSEAAARKLSEALA